MRAVDNVCRVERIFFAVHCTYSTYSDREIVKLNYSYILFTYYACWNAHQDTLGSELELQKSIWAQKLQVRITTIKF